MFVLDDYVFSYRFTPRGVRHTDVEMVFLVHPDAVEGKDYDVEHMVGLWHNTLREDRWVLTQGIANISTSAGYESDWPALFAALTLAILPMIVMYAIFQRQIQAGLTAGALK